MTGNCPRCDPRPIPDQLILELCPACTTDLDRYGSTTGPTRAPAKPWKAPRSHETAETAHTDELAPQTGAYPIDATTSGHLNIAQLQAHAAQRADTGIWARFSDQRNEDNP